MKSIVTGFILVINQSRNDHFWAKWSSARAVVTEAWMKLFCLNFFPHATSVFHICTRLLVQKWPYWHFYLRKYTKKRPFFAFLLNNETMFTGLHSEKTHNDRKKGKNYENLMGECCQIRQSVQFKPFRHPWDRSKNPIFFQIGSNLNRVQILVPGSEYIGRCGATTAAGTNSTRWHHR